MRIFWVHLLSTIRANLVAFCSIVLFVALGAGLFLGIGWSAEALVAAVGETFEAGTVHDVEVQFPAGLSDEDVDALSSIEGVGAVEGRYETHVVVSSGSSVFTARVTSITQDIDRVRLVEGSLPTHAGEVALQRSLATRAGIAVGDVLDVRDERAVRDAATGADEAEPTETADEDAATGDVADDAEGGEAEGGEAQAGSDEAGVSEDAEDADGARDADAVSVGAVGAPAIQAVTPRLATDSLKVVALVDAPEYLTNQSSMIGVCDIGVGAVDFVAYVAGEAFEEASREHYSGLVVRLAEPVAAAGTWSSYDKAIQDTLAEIRRVGEQRARKRLDAVREEAQERIDDTEATLDAGREQVSEGHTSLEESEQRLKEAVDELVSGQTRLEEAEAELAEKQAEGERALDEARAEIDKGQATYDAKAAEVAAAEGRLKEYESSFAEVEGDYDAAMAALRQVREDTEAMSAQIADATAKLDAYEAAVAAEQAAGASADDSGPGGTAKPQAQTITRVGAQTDAAPPATQASDSASLWREFEQSYGRLALTYGAAQGRLGEQADTIERTSSRLDMDVSVNDGKEVPQATDSEHARDNLEAAREGTAIIGELLAVVDGASYEVEGVTVRLTDVRAGLREARSKIDDAKGELADARERLRTARSEFNTKKSEFERVVNEGRAQLRESAAKLEEGRESVGRGMRELDDGKTELSRAERELREGEGRLADAKDAIVALDGLGWIVTSRTALGAWRGPDIVVRMLGDVRWAMASIFVVVGLLVCYSAVSRIVYAEMTQIGTLAAMGFRRRRIGATYLAFAASAVLVGMVLSVAVAILLVEGNVNPAMARSFTIEPIGRFASMAELAAMSGFELATILASAWLAVATLLRLEARDLVVGETKRADSRIVDAVRSLGRLAPGVRMAVLNLMGDTRRVVATLVGVCGCTALIVVGLTLDADVAATPKRHYERVYDFDAIAYLDDSHDQAPESLGRALEERGMRSAAVFLRQMMVNLPDGTLSFATVVVSCDDKAFADLYHLAAKGQAIAWPQDGLFVSAAFTEHRGWGPGEVLRLVGADGLVADLEIASPFDFHLLRQEFVCSADTWRKATGGEVRPSALLVDTGGADVSDLKERLSGVAGFERLVDDRGEATYAFGEVSGLLKVVVAVFLTLAALMAALVLLSLDVLYVSERRRELSVLMVLGFTVADAKAYVWRDSVPLTIAGIVLGLVSGCAAARATLRSLEPITGNFVRDVSWPSVGVAALLAAAFATVAMLVALREVSRFDICDVNRG